MGAPPASSAPPKNVPTARRRSSAEEASKTEIQAPEPAQSPRKQAARKQKTPPTKLNVPVEPSNEPADENTNRSESLSLELDSGDKATASTHVSVMVRIRPATMAELSKRERIESCVDALHATNQIRIRDPDGKALGATKPPSKTFTFDKVFSMEDGQKRVHEVATRRLIRKCLEGYNGCIFAYGQSASGKTYTIQGPPQATPDQYGILQRVAIQIMEHVQISTKPGLLEFQVKASYLEIYQDELVDLLVGRANQADLRIRQDTEDGGLHVQGISERTVGDLRDIMSMHTTGSANRTVGETNLNEASSRSHAIMTITIVESRKNASIDKMVKKTSKIHIVDLAGSERAQASGATGARLREGSAINQSLSALGNVINALTQPDRTHIPYRDSKLTYLLSDSLGGNSLTLMIACVSPVAFNYDESLSTLRFADRAKHIENYAKMNTDPMILRILALEAEVKELKRRLKNCTCGGANRDDDAVDPGFCSFLFPWRRKKRASRRVAPVSAGGNLVPRDDTLNRSGRNKGAQNTESSPPSVKASRTLQ